MSTATHSDTTICAPATSTGGAIAIIRISGPETLDIIQGISGKDTFKPRYAHYVTIRDQQGNRIDDAIVTYYPAPHSYTGEHAAEISCHASDYIVTQILQQLTRLGATPAQPGEFTQRAFLNGKMDLAQAEAVADLIASTNAATHRMAMSQLRGGISSELHSLSDQLQRLTALLELELDFSEHEDLEFADRTELLNLSQTILQAISKLAESFKTGRAIKQGIGVTIVGKTNVGKSTLLNRLLGEERAIVSDTHGTTRDTIEDTITLHGITFRFIDTAGLRQTSDAIEQIGIQRTYQAIEQAQIVLWLIDQQPTDDELQTMQIRCQDKHLLIIQNKIDTLQQPTMAQFGPSTMRIPQKDLAISAKQNASSQNKTINIASLAISAKQNMGIGALEEAIYAAANIPQISENDVIVTSARHYEILLRAQTPILRVIDALTQHIPADLVAEDLRATITTLNEITGQSITPETTLQSIFSHFCIGK